MFFHALAAIASVIGVQAVTAQTALPAGEWTIESRAEGGPGNAEAITHRACLTGEALAQPEQAFFDGVAAASASKRGAPKCKFEQINRNGAQSTWIGECEGPFGAVPSKGSGSFEANRGQLRQSITLKTPMGSRTLTQILSVAHVGACAKP